MRCPDCNKFVPYDTEQEPDEASEPEIDETTFRVSYTRTLTCGECGTELKSAEIEIEHEITITPPSDDARADDEFRALHPKLPKHIHIAHDWTECPALDSDGEHEWDFDLNVEPTTGVIDTDRHGRKIRNPRYMTTTYGVSISGSATCSHCGACAEIDAAEALAASSFDEKV